MNAKRLPSRVRKSTIDVISAYKDKIKDEKYFFNSIKKIKKTLSLLMFMHHTHLVTAIMFLDDCYIEIIFKIF